MTDKRIVESEVNSVKNVTHRIIRMDGNLIKLILVSLICIVVGVASVIVPFSPSVLFVDQDEATITPLAALITSFSVLTFFGAFIFVFLPCVSGVLYFVRKTVSGEKPGFIELFTPFRVRGRYGSALILPIVMILRGVIIVLPLVGGIMNLPLFYEMSSEMSTFELIADSSFILCLAILAACVGAYLSSFLFFVPYLVVSGKAKFFASLVESIRISHRKRIDITRHVISQTGNVFIGLISFLVLWVFVSAPRISVSYFVFCDKIFEEAPQVDYE